MLRFSGRPPRSMTRPMSPAEAALSDHPHFTRAVARMAERRRVVTHSPIYNHQGLKVIDKGFVVDARLYEQLAQHRLSAPLADCLAVEDAVTAAGLCEAVRALAAAEPLLAALLHTPRIGDMVLEELSLAPLPPSVALQLTAMRETQPELWLHSLRSALLAGWLGARRGGTRYDVRMLCVAGLLHDVGMLHLDPALLEPEAAFSGEQRRQLYSHPLLSVLLLERHHQFPRELLQAVLEHHEALDGSGYPRQVSGPALSPWGRVLSLVEVATALAMPARARAARRLSLVLRLNHHRFDADLARELAPVLARLGGGSGGAEGAVPAVERLQAIDTLLHDWPATAPGLDAARTDAVQRVHEQCAQVLAMMAAAGAAAPQLARLGPQDEADPALADELVLVDDEMRWQLRAVARHVRRLWRRKGGEAFPAWVQAWLDRAEPLQR